MPISATEHNVSLCLDALRKIGVVRIGVPSEGEETEHALRALSRMLKSWQMRGDNLWLQSTLNVALDDSIGFVLDPKPFRVCSMRLRHADGREIPMHEMTREDYDDLPVKSSRGTPTTFYVDRQREQTIVNVWPVLNVANGESLQITYIREIEDVEPNEDGDIPAEWYEAVVYGLAARLADDYQIPDPRIQARAAEEFLIAAGHDREDSVYFTYAS